MARKEANLKNFGLTQFLEKEYWDWGEASKIVENGTLKDIGTEIIRRIEISNPDSLEEFYLIRHNKDMRKKWDDSISNYVLDAKMPHIHCVGRFKKGKEMTLSAIALAVGVESQYVEKPKSGRYSYDNMLAYLIHAKDTSKAEYEPKEVVTLRGEPYQEIYNSRREAWISGRAKVTKERAKLGADGLEESILNGEVTRQQVLLTDEFFEIYSRNSIQMDRAFDIYAERKAYKTIRAMENGEFLLTVFFIYGKSRSGKSYFTDELVKRIKKSREEMGDKWTATDAAASNPVDDYRGEEILILDDLRGVAMTSSDWLKLLDPERIGRSSARYKNKLVASRVVIINSTKTPLEYFYYVKQVGGGDRSEAMDQFFARILKLIKVIKLDDGERIYKIEDSKETDPYKLKAPDGALLDMNYKFSDNEDIKDFEEAIDTLIKTINDRNDLLPF